MPSPNIHPPAVNITNKLLIITGPTAAGKTALGLETAGKFNGEIISADSRQVYKYMDIGTGKDVNNFQFSTSNLLRNQFTVGYYDTAGVNIWGLDLVEPNYHFNVSDYIKCVKIIIKDIRSRGKLPIIVGGTVQYIKALLAPFETINIPPDEELRTELSKFTIVQLQKELQRVNSNRWAKMNLSDRNNPRRLIRAIEVTKSDQHVMNRFIEFETYESYLVVLMASYDFLYKRIDERVDNRVKMGILEEIKSLQKRGYGWNLPSMTGLGYREFQDYFKSPTSENLDQAIQQWKFDEHSYARRQKSFLNNFANQFRNSKISNILEVNIEQSGWKKEVFDQIRQWYSRS